MSKKIFVLMGPSGSGKTSVLGAHLKDMGIPELISHTTRPMRPGEVNGETYYFTSEKEFELVRKAECPAGGYAGNKYCLSVDEITNKLALNEKVHFIADVRGVMQIKEAYPNETVAIYVSMPFEEMRKRMEARGDKEDVIAQRIEYARQTGAFYDYVLADYVVENIDKEKAIERLNLLISMEDNNQEIERKFIVGKLPDLSYLPRTERVIHYLSFLPEVQIYSKDDSYIKQTKRERLVSETITQEEFEKLSKKSKKVVTEMCYYTLVGNNVLEIEVFKGEDKGYELVTATFATEEEAKSFVLPSWFGVEITERNQTNLA